MLGGIDSRTLSALIKRAVSAIGVTFGSLSTSGTLTIGGTSTFNGEVVLSGAMRSTAIISPPQITSNQNDYAPSGHASANVYRISSDARRNLTGLAGGASGLIRTVHNVGTFPICFKYEDTGSAAANRFAFGLTLGGNQSVQIQYDVTSSRWRLYGTAPIPVGTILPFGGGTVPEGFLARDGSNVSRTTYAALFNEVGTAGGAGDGSTTFGVGDDRRRVWVGSGGSASGTLSNTVGSTGGAETVTLTTAMLPASGLTVSGSASGTVTYTAGGGAGGNNADFVGGAGSDSVNGVQKSLVSGSISGTTSAMGSGQAHSIMQPSIVITSMIKF